MRAFFLFLLLLLPTDMSAQSIQEVLESAAARKWVVRALLANDTIAGAVRVFSADTVIMADRRVSIQGIVRIDRRLWAGDSTRWHTIWLSDQAPEHVIDRPPPTERDTVRYQGPFLIPYLGTGAVGDPAPIFTLPPPLLAGAQAGYRSSRSELTVNLRGLLFYGGVLFGGDVGFNALTGDGSYAGLALGALSGGETFFPTVGVRAGSRPKRDGVARLEARADFIVVSYFGMLLTISIGADRW